MKYLRIALALVLFGLLLWWADPKALALLFLNLSLPALCLLLLISVLLVYISALKWHLFIESFGENPGVIKLFGLYLVGYFVNTFVPSYVGGDVARSYYLGKKIGQHQAATATILERYTGLVAMIFLGLCFVWFAPAVTWEIKAAVVLIAAGLVVLTVVALSPRLIEQIARWPHFGRAFSQMASHFGRIQEGLRFAGRTKGLLKKTFALSFLYHTFTVVNTLTAGWVVGWYDAPLLSLFVVLPLILLIGALPITPSGLGLQEGAFFFFLKAIGASPAQALSIALILRAKTYVLALAGGLLWVNGYGRSSHGQNDHVQRADARDSRGKVFDSANDRTLN